MTASAETNGHDMYESLAERGYADVVGHKPSGNPHAHSQPPTHTREKSLSGTGALSKPDAFDGHHHSHGPSRGLSPRSVGKAMLSRFLRAVRRGNLPFLIIFLTALFVFFGALAGIGYVDPDIASNTPAAAQPAREFVVGEPVFDPSDAQLEREARAAEQRALEEVWARQKRPNAGAWMQKQRNDRAVRFKILNGGAAPALPWETDERTEDAEVA